MNTGKREDFVAGMNKPGLCGHWCSA